MYRIGPQHKANQLRRENNDLQLGIEYQLKAINESLKELITLMKGE